ncbi:low temperature requirement protein A [Microbacterium sp. VKM Ac-2870]|uniref:low temperature requirement protein A n=1 Tax=Microbacterium sp. VKM Ac-2870 TaxID=2783825 RepID=UPI001E3E6DF3|nr:low temperature requirement protein A [Microbacterium sp. VKM Ac-2870]
MTTPTPAARARRGIRSMTAREPGEQHRAASPLELFFDLVFVVAVSLSSQQLHLMESHGELGLAVASYIMVFFTIWWAWMNFTWFGTSFAVDDWLYRVMTIIQMAGVLVLASGITAAMQHGDFTIVTFGYVIMRLAMVAQWLRAAASVPEFRRVCLRYAGAIALVQVAWVLRLLLPPAAGLIAFFVLVLAESLVPVWAERDAHTPWNARHITERYSLFTLILLGESILASAGAIIDALDRGEHTTELIVLSAAGLVIAAGMWWVYFSREHHRHIRTLASSIRFGYFHYVIFAAAGAFSAGIEVAVDDIDHEAALSNVVAHATLTVPVALFILGIWVLTVRAALTLVGNVLLLVGVTAVLAATFVPTPIGMLVTAAVGTTLAVVAVELGRPPRT